jgi:hypothetical protein
LGIYFFAVPLQQKSEIILMTTIKKEYDYDEEYIQLGSNRSYWNKHLHGKAFHKAS